MIARDLRLRSPLEFERVRSTGRSWSNRLLVLIVAENELGRNRYGFAVGRGVGNAVRRNRAKRLMREATRQLQPYVKQGYDCIWIARNRFGEHTTQQEIEHAARDLLARAGLLAERWGASGDAVRSVRNGDDTV